MGRSGPPGRRGTQRDVGHRARAATPSGGPLRPTEGRGLLPPRQRCGRLVVLHTTAPPAPSERIRDRSEMGDYYRDLVLTLARLEARILLVDDIDSALAPHHATVLIPRLCRLQGVDDLHGSNLDSWVHPDPEFPPNGVRTSRVGRPTGEGPPRARDHRRERQSCQCGNKGREWVSLRDRK